MKYGSLFSGIGGFDLGLDRAGMECAWQCEIDPAARSVLERHWPGVLRYEDVRNVGRNAPPVDLICGGFPCQDVSVAGSRAGLAGERSGLWFEFHRVVAELSPQWVIVENVPGLLSSNAGRDFAVILRGLVKCGYGVAWRILDAEYFGIPQRRRRVFIVGCLGADRGRSAEVLFESEGMFGNPPARRTAGTSVAGTLAAGAPASGFNGRDADRGNVIAFDVDGAGMDATDNLSPTLKHGGSKPHHHNAYRKMAIAYSDNSPDVANTIGSHHGRNDLDSMGAYVFESRFARNGRGAPDTIAPPLKAQNGGTGKGDGAPLVAYNIQHNDGGQHKRKDRPEGGLYVNETETALTVGTTDETVVAFAWQQGVSANDRSYPVRSGDYAGSLSGSRVDAVASPAAGVRRLTPIECERLQGFPDGWTDGQSDSARYRQLGNAVAVPVAEWLGRRLVAVYLEKS